MDTSMIIGLALAGSIVMLTGNKNKANQKSDTKPNATEFVVRLGDDAVAFTPKKKAS